MNTGNHTICGFLLIALFVSIAQNSNAQESELGEDMRRWLREQNNQLDLRPPSQQQRPPSLNIPQIQHQLQRQPEVLRISPTTRLPSYLNRIQTPRSLEETKYRNMFRNLDNLDLNAPRVDGGRFNLSPQNVAHQVTTEGGGISLPCPDIRRAEQQRERLRGMGIEPLPTRFDINHIYEIIERANQVLREMKDQED